MKSTANVFNEMEYFWAEIADKSQTERQINFLKKHLGPKKVILDVACGTGRHLISLSKLGFEIVGIDLSAKLLKIAKRQYIQACLVRADIRFLPFILEAFNAAISVDTTFGYASNDDEDLQILNEIGKALKQHSVLIVDVFNQKYLIQKYDKRSSSKRLKWVFLPLLIRFHNRWLLFKMFKWREYPSFFLLQKRILSRNGGLLLDLWVVWEKISQKILIFNHRVRLYTFKSLKELLNLAGFDVQLLYGNYEEQEFCESSPRLIFVSIKK